MIKKLIIMAVLTISAGSCFGQWVYKDAKNRIVLDCSEKTGYPQAGVVKTIDRTGIQDLTITAWMFSNIKQTSYLRTSVVAERLEIQANANFAAGSRKDCGASSGVNSWRLPTPSEIVLIQKFYTQMVSLGMTAESGNSYTWAFADAYDYLNSGAGDASHGMMFKMNLPTDATATIAMSSGTKTVTNSYFVRCVREITD